jgi:CBS domain-containing protein
MKSCVRDVMTTRVVAVKKPASFKEMIVRMRKSHISAFPVVDDAGVVIGVVSEDDLLNKEADLATGTGSLASILRFRDHDKAAGITAAELMTSPPLTVSPDAPLAEAACLMRDRRVKRLPVINATGHLIGIISRSDVLSVFTRPDAEIRSEAAEEVIAESFVTDSRGLAVTVHDGIVTLTGRAETEQVGHELMAALRHIDGVIAVRDQLSYAGVAG